MEGRAALQSEPGFFMGCESALPNHIPRVQGRGAAFHISPGISPSEAARPG
jgi:hypothetical protein